jgi:phage-related protein
LYFFHGQDAVILTNGFAKERKLPQREIDLAAERMAQFKADPERHTFAGL